MIKSRRKWSPEKMSKEQSMKTLLSQSSKPSIFDPTTYQNMLMDGNSPSP